MSFLFIHKGEKFSAPEMPHYHQWNQASHL